VASSQNSSSSIRVLIKHEKGAKDFSCWSGEWRIDADQDTISTLKFGANLKAVAKFLEGDEDNPILFPGVSQKFKVVLQQIDNPAALLDPAELKRDLDFEVTGTLVNPSGEEFDTLFDDYGAVLNEDDLFSEVHTLSVGKGDSALIGENKIRLTLSIQIPSSTAPISPFESEIPVIIGNPAQPPTVKSPLQLGTLSGSAATRVNLEVVGGDQDTCIDFSKAKVTLTAAPKGLEGYKVSGGCVLVKSGETVTVPFEITPEDGSKENSVGPLAGTFSFSAQIIDSSIAPLIMAPVGFDGYQDAAPNDIARWILIVVFMVLSMLLAYVLLVIISKYVARFPTGQAIAELRLQAHSLSVSVTKSGIRSSSENRIEQVLDDPETPVPIRVSNRKEINVSGIRLLAKSSGAKLASAGYATTSQDFIGLGGPELIGVPGQSSTPVLGLGLQNTWMLIFNKAELVGRVFDDSFKANAQLIVIIDVNAPIEAKMELVSKAEWAAGENLGKLIANVSKPAQSISETKKSKKNKQDLQAETGIQTATQAVDPWGSISSPSKPESSNATPSQNTAPPSDPWTF
jgi:hypothetical protein